MEYLSFIIKTNMKKKFKIFLSHALIDNGNKGCIALSHSSVYLIDKILKRNNIDYEILINTHPNSPKIKIQGKEYSYKSFTHPASINFKSNPFKLFSKENIKGIKCLKKIDLHLELASGDSFSDIYGITRFKFINRICKLSRILKKEYIFLPQTIGPFLNKKVEKEALITLKSASSLMARDKISKDFANDLLGKKIVKEYVDLAFLLPFTKQNFNNKEINIGLNISGLLYVGGYTHSNQFNLIEDYKITINRLIESLLKIDNVKIHLIPHVYSLEEKEGENDYYIMDKISKAYNSDKIILSPLFFNPSDAKSYISGMDFFIGSRMHSTIAAFSSGVPVLPLSYSRKFEGLFEDTLNYPYVIDLKSNTSDIIISQTLEFISKRDVIKTIISDRLETIVKPKLEMLEKDLEQILLKVAKK